MSQKADSRPVSIRDVAALAGVSLSTASRAINNAPNVNEEIRKKVARAVTVLGYRPNHAAQSLRRRSSLTIGCMFTDVTNPLYGRLYRMIEERLRKEGYMLLLANSLNNAEREVEILSMFEERGMDGVIIAPGNERDQRVVSAVENLKIPMVVLDRDVGANKDRVLFEHGSGLKALVSYLADLGHRDIAMVLGRTGSRPTRRRIEGFRAGMRENGLTVPDGMVVELPTSMSSAFASVSELLARKKRPSALIAHGTLILNETLNAISAAGLRIPEDVSLASIGDPDFAKSHVPPITTVRVDIEAAAEKSTVLLLDRIRGKDEAPPASVKISTDVIIRGSCASPAKKAIRGKAP